MRNYLLTIVLSVAALFVGGCDAINFIAYVFAPSAPTKTVEAEFDGLKDQTVAVVVFADPEIQLDYNMAQLELTDAIGAQLKRCVSNVTVVDARRVLRYQAENPGWDVMPPEKLCDVFKSGYVMLISLLDFSTREPGSIHLARGRITAEVSIYKAGQSSCDGENPVWRTGPITTVFPTESPLGIPTRDEWTLRIRTERIFADKLVRKFYKHEVPKEPQ